MAARESSGAGQGCFTVRLNDVDVHYIRRGSGRPILFLHPHIGLQPDLPVLDMLAEQGMLIAPFHPGFMGTSTPRRFSHIDDLAYLYLDFMNELDLRDVVVVGVSFGAWIAAEIGIKSCERISHLILAAPVGIKIGSPDQVDLVDMFSVTAEQFCELAYADPAPVTRDLTDMSEELAEMIACNREAAALYGWLPYMNDPKLRDRLPRISVPTLVLRGDSDGIITERYARSFTGSTPGSCYDVIAKTGHFPHIEQPRAFVEKIRAFADG